MQNLCSADFFKTTPYNSETKTQIWMSIISDSHDNICNCWHPFAHLLATIFPPGHQDRDLTINQILKRDYQEACRSGGDAERRIGGADCTEKEDTTDIKEEKQPEETIEDALMAAAAAAAENPDAR